MEETKEDPKIRLVDPDTVACDCGDFRYHPGKKGSVTQMAIAAEGHAKESGHTFHISEPKSYGV